MLQIAGSSTKKVLGVLASDDGVPAAVEALVLQQGMQLTAVGPQQIIGQNVAPDLAEQSTISNYPLIYVYCNKVVNQLREKFRTFSGDAQMVVEARVSQDRLDQIETNLQAYVDAITQVLDNSRGDWGDGVLFDGGYEVTFSGVKHGGRNFLQIAKVAFTLEISAG
ncbi:MAG: hypothetical protein ABSG13_14955 [Bryobacteraceae bacterium]|jgi:hypothetical protein